jgi:eukaryotic-like serine/threonine-protein kinase
VNPSRWREVNTLFHTLLERDAAERERLLADAEAADPELAREVRSLLRSHERSASFLDAPVWAAAPELLAEDEPSMVGRQIGAYRIVEEIGRGGMGVVYTAKDERLGRMVALKALPAAYTSDPARRARLTREARAAAALSHPAIATIFALEDTGDGLYIVSELVRGRTLREELRDGPLTPRRVLLSTLMDIAGALEAAHGMGIVHRDLKPENVIRRTDGQIKVLDFGLARWAPHPDAPSMTRLTEAGIALGTPGYMAPEQLSGGETDARADIFSFGVLAWELATGEHPFGREQGAILARMAGLMDADLADLIKRGTALPGRSLPGLDRVALRCLRASPSDRYASASALIEDLRALEAALSDPAAPLQRPPAPALWWWQFHQAILAVLDAATPLLALLVRQSIRAPHGRWIFLAVLALATIAVTLRLNLLFTSRVHAPMLALHRTRLFPWIAAAEGLLAGVLLVSALMLGTEADTTAAPLLSVALILVASLAIIEPNTTAGAGLTPGAKEGTEVTELTTEKRGQRRTNGED